MTKNSISMKYEIRHALSSMFAIVAAGAFGYYVDANNVMWAALGALLVVQTSRGTPVRQGLITLFAVILVLFAGHLAANEIMTMHRIMMVLMGGVIGMLCGLLVLPVLPYAEFQHGVQPVLNALTAYSSALGGKILQSGEADLALGKARVDIERVFCSSAKEYPEWVFEEGFNRNFRSSFRYVLIQLDRAAEIFFSLDYHVRQPVDAELLAAAAPPMILVLEKNAELLEVICSFFLGKRITMHAVNYTSDIIDLHNVMRNVLPGGVELLDVVPDYLNLAALSRGVIDMREILLQIAAGLPMDDDASAVNDA